MPYCFSRSSIKFQGHTGRRIDDLNPIWVRLLGRSQLSNPSDLPCYILNHLRKAHKLIGHSFGRNLHKSNMAATCQEIALYFKHACTCYIFMRFKFYFHNRDIMPFPLYKQEHSIILLFVEIQYGCRYQSYIITKTIVGKNLLVSIITR